MLAKKGSPMNKLRIAMQKAMDNLGVPQPEYPAPVAEAYRLLAEGLNEITSLHELCVEAVEKAYSDHISHHTSFISAEDDISFGLKEGGRIPKVTIEWVDASEADPKNFEAA
jgi:hypothetical protein